MCCRSEGRGRGHKRIGVRGLGVSEKYAHYVARHRVPRKEAPNRLTLSWQLAIRTCQEMPETVTQIDEVLGEIRIGKP